MISKNKNVIFFSVIYLLFSLMILFFFLPIFEPQQDNIGGDPFEFLRDQMSEGKTGDLTPNNIDFTIFIWIVLIFGYVIGIYSLYMYKK